MVFILRAPARHRAHAVVECFLLDTKEQTARSVLFGNIFRFSACSTKVHEANLFCSRFLAALCMKNAYYLAKNILPTRAFVKYRGFQGALGNFRQGMTLASFAAMPLDDFVHSRPMEVIFASHLPNCTT